jgi:phosphatidylglycerol:prolipoprotein diacylglycerol transferase
MLPVLQLGPFAIQTYPLALVLAGWVALTVGARAAKWLALDGDHIYNAGLYGLVAGVVVGRLAHVLAFWPAYRAQPLEIFGFNTAAFLLWPSIVAAVAVAGWYVYRRRLPLAAMLDAFAPGLLCGLAVAAAGALLTGRNPGAPASLPWSVTLWGVERHPIQIYEMVALIAVAAYVLRLIRLGSRGGAPALTALLGLGLTLWFAEAFRSTDIHETASLVTATVFGGLRLGQILGLALAILALFGLRYLSTRVRSADPQSA